MDHPILIEGDPEHFVSFEVDDPTYCEIVKAKTNRYLGFVMLDFGEREPTRVDTERIHLLH